MTSTPADAGMLIEYIATYITSRVDDQFAYFNSAAIKNQRRYKFLKWIAIVCNVSTTMAIGLLFAVPADLGGLKLFIGILALALSAIVLATYQVEEFANFGAKWEKFRLVAESLKSEKHLFLASAGRYADRPPGKAERLFVEHVEGLIRGTDLAYFSLLVEPGRRIDKRLEQPGTPR